MVEEAAPSLPEVAPLQFATGGVSVTRDHETSLRTVADALASAPAWRVEIRGHADRRGARKLNRRLALSRARAVRDVLVGLGVDPKRIKVASAGSREPARRGIDASSLAANRRVEIQLHKGGPS